MRWADWTGAYAAVYLVYAALSAVALHLAYPRPDRWIRLPVVLALPGVGWLLLAAWDGRRKDDRPDIGAIAVWEQAAAKMPTPVDREAETNIVPIGEALLVSDPARRRRSVLELLKRDVFQYLDHLRDALQNDDAETVHYAATALTDLKGKLMGAIRDLEANLERSPDDPQLLRTYVEVLQKYIRVGFLDDRAVYRYRHKLSQALGRLAERLPDDVAVYVDKVNNDLAIGLWQEAEQTALRCLERFPDREEPYLALMNIYYAIRSREKLENVLAELQRSGVRLSKEGWEVVRFWRERGER